MPPVLKLKRSFNLRRSLAGDAKTGHSGVFAAFFDELCDDRAATTAACTRPALTTNLLLSASPSRNAVADGLVVDDLAMADEHGEFTIGRRS